MAKKRDRASRQPDLATAELYCSLMDSFILGESLRDPTVYDRLQEFWEAYRQFMVGRPPGTPLFNPFPSPTFREEQSDGEET